MVWFLSFKLGDSPSKIVYVRPSTLAGQSLAAVKLIKLKTRAYFAIGDGRRAVRAKESAVANGELALSPASYLTSAAAAI